MTTLSYADTVALVKTRARSLLSDMVVDFSTAVSADGQTLRVERAPADPLEVTLTPHALGQLKTLMGVRSSKWMRGASEAKRAVAFQSALSVCPPHKLRLRRSEDRQEVVCYAILPPSLTPIEDVRVFGAMDRYLRGVCAEYEFVRVDADAECTQYTALRRDFSLRIGDTDYRAGWHLTNSTTGGAALTVLDVWQRADGACLLGLQKDLMYRTHRPIDKEDLAAALMVAFGTTDLETEQRKLFDARALRVAHPQAAAEAALSVYVGGREVIRHAEELAEAAIPNATRFSVAWACAEAAPSDNLLNRREVERLAGAYLATATVRP